jgi:excisionase family DNA binding protein
MTVSETTLERIVRRLQREVAELRARLDAFEAAPRTDASTPQHSAAKLAWAKRHDIDLSAFEPHAPPALGTHTMTVAQAARELDLSIEQVRRHLRSGNLRGTPLGGRAGWRVSRADVARMAETRRALAAERA